MPNINPAMLVMQALGAGQPLNNILGNLAGQGAQYAKAVELIKGKDAHQLQTMAQNMAKERGFADVGYRMATDTCAINTNVANNTRDIIDAMNSGFRGISDRMTAQEIATKDAQIAAQAQKIFGLELAASQQAQNQYLVSQLGCKAPVPAFNVPAPWQYGNYGCSDCSNY